VLEWDSQKGSTKRQRGEGMTFIAISQSKLGLLCNKNALLEEIPEQSVG
jgi:hypothetical protein